MDREDLDSEHPNLLLIGAGKPIPKYTFRSTQCLSGARKRPKQYQRRRKKPRPVSVEISEEVQTGATNPNHDVDANAFNANAVARDLEEISFDEFEYGGDGSSSEVSQDITFQQVVASEVKDIYMVHLVQAKSFIRIDDSFNSFLMQDFDVVQKQLMLHKFQMIDRYSLKLSGQNTWLLACSCDENRSKFIKSLDCRSHMESGDVLGTLTAQYPDCLHISVSCNLIATMDKVNNIEPHTNDSASSEEDHGYSKSFPCIQELDFSAERLILVKPADGTAAVLGVDRKGFLCYTCKYGRHSCSHVSFLKTMIEKSDENLPDFVVEMIATHTELANSKIKSFELKTASVAKIPWATTPQQRLIYRLSSYYLSNVPGDGFIPLIPEEMPCVDCGGHMSIVTLFDPNLKQLLLWSDIIKVKVYGRECENCGHRRGLCGSADGMLNMKSFLLGHDVLRDYLHQFLTGNSCSLIGYHEKWRMNMVAAGINLDSMINYQQWRFSWYSFLKLLDIDYQTGFKCDICGEYPEILSCDATSLGFKKTFLRRSDLFTKIDPNSSLQGSSFSCRVMLTNKKLRSLLRKYCTKETLENDALCSMKQLLGVESVELANFLVWCDLKYQCIDYYPPAILRLLRCISSISPVISYFPNAHEFLELFHEIKEGLEVRKVPQKLFTLQRIAPVICDCIVCLPEGELPEEILQLFGTLELKVKWILGKEPHFLETISAEENQGDLAFLPNWPIINVRGIYKKDISKSKKAQKDCRKEYRGHPSLMPGIFTLYCHHDICYGFDIMESQESPNTPFTILRSRFKRAPRTVIYDNSCNLHQYCLNRDPGFFRETSFLVDRFHWKNHTACADSYNLSLHVDYKNVNSQINEQRNSMLKKVKNQLSYMNPVNFTNHCKILLWNSNQRAKQLLNARIATGETQLVRERFD